MQFAITPSFCYKFLTMPVPKKRHSHSRTRKRRSKDGLKGRNGIVCTNCGSQKMPHIVCKTCGYYRGRLIVAVS